MLARGGTDAKIGVTGCGGWLPVKGAELGKDGIASGEEVTSRGEKGGGLDRRFAGAVGTTGEYNAGGF